MAPSHCPAKDDPDSTWPPFCPNVGASYFYAVLFLLTLVAHIAQAIIHRKGYSWVVSMSALWQFLTYVIRIISIKNPTQVGYYSAWFILMLLAPLWINAYVYMVLGRMVYNYTSKAKILGVPAWRFGLYFVLLDIVAFIIQAAGASMASGDDIPHDDIMRGLHVYMGGVGLQQALILCFVGVAIRFQRQMSRESPMRSKSRALVLLYVVYAVLTLISIRIIFRLIEYANGYETGIPTHEAYQYVFDSTMMLLALLLFNIVHPGRIMPGTESDFPSRKDRKAAGKNHQWGRAGRQDGDAPQAYESSSDLQMKPQVYNATV